MKLELSGSKMFDARHYVTLNWSWVPGVHEKFPTLIDKLKPATLAKMSRVHVSAARFMTRPRKDYITHQAQYKEWLATTQYNLTVRFESDKVNLPVGPLDLLPIKTIASVAMSLFTASSIAHDDFGWTRTNNGYTVKYCVIWTE